MTALVRQNAAGDSQLGAYIEGAFVPFVTLTAARVAQLVENATNRGDTEPKAKRGKSADEPEEGAK